MAQLESLSYSLFWVGLFGVALTSLLYAAALWGWHVVVQQAATDAGTVTLTERLPLPSGVGRAAAIVCLGFPMILFNIFAVNFWIAGLHSYAGN